MNWTYKQSGWTQWSNYKTVLECIVCLLQHCFLVVCLTNNQNHLFFFETIEQERVKNRFFKEPICVKVSKKWKRSNHRCQIGHIAKYFLAFQWANALSYHINFGFEILFLDLNFFQVYSWLFTTNREWCRMKFIIMYSNPFQRLSHLSFTCSLYLQYMQIS